MSEPGQTEATLTNIAVPSVIEEVGDAVAAETEPTTNQSIQVVTKLAGDEMSPSQTKTASEIVGNLITKIRSL